MTLSKKQKEYRKRYYAENHEKIKLHKKLYDVAHREKRDAYNAKYYIAHREKAIAYSAKYNIENANYQARWHSAHRKERAVYAATWRKTHPEKCRESNSRKRAHRVNVPINNFTEAQWKEIRVAHQDHCYYCQKSSDDLTQDHMLPITRGGSHTISNIVPACRSCNSEKKAKTVQEYFDYITGGW